MALQQEQCRCVVMGPRNPIAVHRVVFMLTALCMVAIALPTRAQELPSVATTPMLLEKTSDIKAQPLALLAKFPAAGPAMARYVAQALMHEPSAVDAVLSIIPDTSPEQAAAIGAGLIRAIRGLAGKQPNLITSITSKVMQSDNLWLKTTFLAIGPRGAGKPPPNSIGASDTLRYPTADNAGGAGGAIGQLLAPEYGRVGPSRIDGVMGMPIGFIDKNPFLSGLNVNMTRYGMIVALVSSDADSNGVVPISP